MSLPVMDLFPAIVQATVALAAGLSYCYADAKDTDGHLTGCVIRMFPFFLLGRMFDWDRLVSTVPEFPGRLLIGWTAFGVFVAGYISSEASFDKVILALDDGPNKNIYRSFVRAGCDAELFLLWARYVDYLLCRGLMGFFFFLFCVPRRPVFFSPNGAHTMFPYLLHTPLLPFIMRLPIWVATTAYKGAGPVLRDWPVRGLIYAAALFSVAFVLTYVLSSWPCRVIFKLTVTPEWILPEWWRQTKRYDEAPGEKCHPE
eukprot:gnl/TRDRNA2_/TRDRNA2_149734_c0_seq2.p1 gnl/TRDRNA2_/TRDRNA2_149734_c0~~gnl/TRDRNA2_/TRDRNA2_149734_c0_seq2.p1  ORF type:complete len:258 (-),score=15.20 gnl/TRDRNA2_/TRDRNA2_149734_c0_seq2:82-855(-)